MFPQLRRGQAAKGFILDHGHRAAHRPRLLAAEIAASVAEFNRPAALATTLQIQVVAVVSEQAMPDGPVPPILAVQVIAPL